MARVYQGEQEATGKARLGPEWDFGTFWEPLFPVPPTRQRYILRPVLLVGPVRWSRPGAERQLFIVFNSSSAS